MISTSVNSQSARPLTPLECKEYIKIHETKYKKIMIILGSEGFGVSPHLSKNSDISLSIERTGQGKYPYELVDSLNVNSALSTILY